VKIGGNPPRWAILSAIGGLGFGLVAIPRVYRWEWDYGVLPDLGIAFLISAILGMTIDRWFKADFGKDVFEAAIGHILGPELRDEIHWVAGFKWIARECRLHLKIEDIGNAIVKVTSTTERTIENISSHPQKIRGNLAADEWGFTDYPSQIIECVLSQAGEAPKKHTGIKRSEAQVRAETEEATVLPKNSIKLFTKVVEYRRTNDSCSMVFAIPTINPQMEVEISESLKYEYGFSHRGVPIKSDYLPRLTLQGTFLPHQGMGARWWPKKINPSA